MSAKRFRSFAKINLGLEVVGRLPDGNHELTTLFAAVSLHDIVEIRETRGEITVESDHPSVPGDETNLAHRAATLLKQASGSKRGAAIRIQKRIPVGGGLGGGSSNAATVLRALDQLWELGLGPEGLLPAARALGADVPYFLVGGPALGRGRGDIVSPVDVRPAGKILLVSGSGGVSTAAVFRRFAAQGSAAARRSRIEAFLHSHESEGRRRPRALSTLRNDLEKAALAESPALTRTARQVREVGRATGARHTAMSGSGSSFFLLFDEPASVATAARALRERGLSSVSCSFVSRRAYASRFEIPH